MNIGTCEFGTTGLHGNAVLILDCETAKFLAGYLAALAPSGAPQELKELSTHLRTAKPYDSKRTR